MKRGYAGVVLILVFSIGVLAFFTLLPDTRFYKDMVKRITSSHVEVYTSVSNNVDDFISASVLSLGVSESTIGLSFGDFARTRNSQEEARKIQKILISSGWGFSASALADMFTPITGSNISALVPNLGEQIDRGFISPNILVVEGNISRLRSVWNLVAGQIMAQTGMTLMETLW